MSVGRGYTATGGLVTYTATSATPILYGNAGATVTADIVAIRPGIASAAGASYPANGTLLVQLLRVTGTRSGGTAVTPAPDNSGDIAANTTWYDATGSAITGLTPGVVLWSQVVPFTAGANWAEYFSPGKEKRVPASGAVAVYVTATLGTGGTATQLMPAIEFVE